MRAGLFVGAARYQDPDIKPLSYPCDDARGLLRQLVRTSGFSHDGSLVCTSDYQASPERGIYNNANKETILTQLASLEIRPELEAFVFFFSGHGFRSSLGIDYLVPQNATIAALPDTSLALADIIRRCCNVNAQNIIIVIDACRDQFTYSASFECIVPSVSCTVFSNRKTSIFFSTDAYTRSYEDDSLKAGIYTSCFCDALEIEYECRRLDELQDFLSQHVPNVCERVGKPKQKPWAAFLGEQTRDFILPVSKLYEKLNLPPSVGREVGRSREVKYYQDYPLPIIIDFGTTKSILAYGTSVGYDFIKDSRGRVCIPSTVKFLGDGNYEVGVDAFCGVDSRYSKRRILTHVFENTTDELGLSADHYAMLVVSSLIKNFERDVRKKARRCVLSIPTDYNILDVSRIVNCVQASGIRVERIIPEPTAAAFNILSTIRGSLSDRRGSKDDFWVMVVDMGGGTLDIAFIHARIHSDVGEVDESEVEWNRIKFSVFASSGDACLGGIDFNSLLKDHFISKLRTVLVSGEKIVAYSEFELEAEIERAKVALSDKSSSDIYLQDVTFSGGASKPFSLRVSRQEFDHMSRDLFARYTKCVEDCISFGQFYDDISDDTGGYPAGDADKEYRSRINYVILAGQSGHVHKFRAYLRKQFPKARIVDEYSERAVARGLAEWLYMGLDVDIEDIAHTYIGVSGVTLAGNRLVISDEPDSYTLIYPTDKIPRSVQRSIIWRNSKRRKLTITTNTIGKMPVPVCDISIEENVFVGGEGILGVSVDEMLTVVVEIRDFHDNVRCWQINNFFRIPSGYRPVGSIDTAAAGLRILQRH
jgi:hypothetical protein